MPTQNQIDANWLNARKSTGPNAPGGKYNSSQYAITHGQFAKSIPLPGESADRFNALMAAYINHFNPDGPDGFDLVESMAANRWRLRRTWTLETGSLTQEQDAQAAATRGEDPPTQTALAMAELANPPRSLDGLSRSGTRYDSSIIELPTASSGSAKKASFVRKTQECGPKAIMSLKVQNNHRRAKPSKRAPTPDRSLNEA